MIKYFKNEFKLLLPELKTLDFKTVYIFLSVAVITFISMIYATPTFYYYNVSKWLINSPLSDFINGKELLMSRLYWFLFDGIIMFALSALSIKFVFKGKLSDFGFQFGDKKFGFLTLILFLAVMIPIVWIVSASDKFAEAYPQGGMILKTNLELFVLYEFCILVYMLGWEFLWRGYMLFGLKPKFGYYSIFIQMIPFFILHRGKPELELFASIVAGLILGVQALRARSFIYCWILHWLVMVSIDSISVFRFLNKFYNIL